MGNSPVVGDKRKRSALTLHSLPHEVILSIVEWTAQLTLEDQLEQERLEHEQQHEHHHEHDHHHHHGPIHVPPLDMLDLPPLQAFGFPGQNAAGDGQGPGPHNGIAMGDFPFVQNFLGFLNNPVPPPPAAPVAGPVPPPVTAQQPDADDTDDEMLRKSLATFVRGPFGTVR